MQFCCIYQHCSTKIKLELKKNILNIGYGINYKYEGMLEHSFDIFYVVMKFILSSIGDLNFSKWNYDNTCVYLDNKYICNADTKKYLLDLIMFCKKIEPFVIYYKIIIKSYNNTTHNIVKNEIDLILPQVPRKQKQGIIITLVSSFIGLAYEDISSFLHHKHNKALHKAIKAMDSKTPIQCNKLIQLENSMIMYGIYNAETLEKLIDTVHLIHNTTSSHERLFAGQQSSLTLRSLYANALWLQHYSINSLLYLRTVQDKCIALYKELITQLHIYATSIRILAKGYLPISLITPSKLKEILSKVKIAIRETNPDYDLVIDRLHLYYDMKLVSFGLDKEKDLKIQFPVFISNVYTATSNIISNRNCTSSNHRLEQTGTLLYTPTDRQAIYCFKLRNIHHNYTARIKDLQKNRLWILLWGTLCDETQV